MSEAIKVPRFRGKRWEKHGDHKEVVVFRKIDPGNMLVWGPYSPMATCPKCGKYMHEHGFISNKIEGKDGTLVCPGSYIVKEKDGSIAAYDLEGK